MPNRLRALAVCAIAALIAVGCATGRDAVTQGGTFEFVSPGGGRPTSSTIHRRPAAASATSRVPR